MERIWELTNGKCIRKYSPEHPLFDAGTRLWAAKYYQKPEMHRNVCRECSRSFLSLRLLDIHISETHDAFFKILSKKKPMYVCLVDGCPETFQHDDKRTRHLVQVHQYPESFSFHKQREARKRRRQQKKKKLMQEKLQSSDMQVDAEAEMLGVCHNEIASCEPTDVDMVELEESMRQLRIPNSIRFGRKRRV
eukprot:jgi/Phyca11/5942/fgenesh1_pm.PHYCAscaffold_9_\